MINSLQLIDFQDMVVCQNILYKSKESFLPLNYEFKKGTIYGLISDFGCGSWGLATCLAGGVSSNFSGKILLNGDEIFAGDYLSKYSSSIPWQNFECSKETPRECIKKALMNSGIPYTVEEIKKIFFLSDARFDRSVEGLSGEIWLFSLAIIFSLGKDIFCYPWLNEIDVKRFETAYTLGIINWLKKQGKIIVVPSSQKRIRKYCDHMVYFTPRKWICR